METTIRIKKETRDSLKKFGCKGETYDEIILKLITSANIVKNNMNQKNQ